MTIVLEAFRRHPEVRASASLEGCGRGAGAVLLLLVTTGLDPVVHGEVRPSMDCRIKSGNDEAKKTPQRQRPSKDAAPAPRPSPFEGRGACHRAGHFGPDPLAATSG